MSSAFGGNGQRPWDGLPNPFNFPTLGEASKNLYQAPPFSRPQYLPNGKPVWPTVAPQRTTTVGRDWMGVGFQQGDLVLASTAGTLSVFEVETIFLDDANGKPYLQNPEFPDSVAHRAWELVIDKSTGQIFHSSRSGKPEMHPVDPSWLGPYLGLVSVGKTYRDIGDPFEKITFQSYRVRVKPVGANAGTKKRSFAQEHITVFGNQMSRDMIERLLDSRYVPVLNP